MNFHDINRIVAKHFITTEEDVMSSKIYNTGAHPRAAAMLICNDLLKASTLKLKNWYNKSNHTTPMRAMSTARNLINTDKVFRAKYRAALLECKILLEDEAEKKIIKQVYNLNHRVRKKGILVRTRSRTLSCTEMQLNELKDVQLDKLLTKHNYAIQLSII